MSDSRGLGISLAAKCRLLFALAVAITLIVALIVPLKWMDALVHESGIRLARRMALTAANRSDLATGDWRTKQEVLDRWWREQAETEELFGPPPRLIRLAGEGAQDQTQLEPFVARAVRHFQATPSLQEAARWGNDPDDTLRYHYALPVRSPEGVLQWVVYATAPALAQAVRNLWWNRVAVGAAAILAAVLAVLVFYLITTKLILSPVKKLRRLAERVAGGDLDLRSELETGDEFEELAAAFNDMLASLNRSQEELRRINVSLDTRLGEVAQANVALFEANKIKSEFLASVSHELRTPLTSIMGFAELLANHPAAGDERAARYLHHILTSARMLLDLINDLLDLAKIEAGKMELRIDKVSLTDICQNLIDFIRPLADKKQLNLTLELSESLPTLHSDGGKIQQILYNLLANAVKFTPAGGRVRLSVELLNHDRVGVNVSDTGPGIPLDKQAKVFEKFQQMDASVTREHGGTGLGLAISKELTVMLGGTISIESQPGAGSTFSLTLPIEAPTHARQPVIRLT